MDAYKFLLLFLIFISSYLAINYISFKNSLNRFKNKSNFFQTKDFKFKKLISKINFLKTKDLFLIKQGNPLKLDVIRYYLFKIILCLTFLCAGLINYNSKLISIIIALLGYFFIDFYIILNKKSRDNEICNDLLKVVNSISLQLSANVSLKNALKYQYENCINKDMKKAMIEFSTCYELSELNIDTAIKSLKNNFEILEIDMFCNALSEYNKTESIIEILDNLAKTLDDKKLEVIKENTRSRIIYITFGVIIALINIILLIFYPLFISIGDGFNNIFK